jgi:hypothetical protein
MLGKIVFLARLAEVFVMHDPLVVIYGVIEDGMVLGVEASGKRSALLTLLRRVLGQLEWDIDRRADNDKTCRGGLIYGVDGLRT